LLKKIDGKLKVFSAATAMLLTPTLAYAAPKAIDPEAAISKVLNAVIGVGVGIATLYCAANAIFLIISYMSKQENHDRAELKGKVQYLIILEILACIIGGLIYWVKGLVGY
jgi:predicted ATP-grasp superfamily ATP-dependent carboligase